jgi:hypothetical protein
VIGGGEGAERPNVPQSLRSDDAIFDDWPDE